MIIKKIIVANLTVYEQTYRRSGKFRGRDQPRKCRKTLVMRYRRHCYTSNLKAGVWVSYLWLGRSRKQEVEGHREVGEVGEEEIVLRVANVVLEGVVEHCPILSQ